MGSHRVGHDWSDLAAAAVPIKGTPLYLVITCLYAPMVLRVTNVLFQGYWNYSKYLSMSLLRENLLTFTMNTINE